MGETFFENVLVDCYALFFADTSITGFDGKTAQTLPISLDFENIFSECPRKIRPVGPACGARWDRANVHPLLGFTVRHLLNDEQQKS